MASDDNSPQYQKLVGQGNYTADMLASWESIETRLMDRGHDQEVLSFIYATAVCPKGHDDHINQTAAARKFFPALSPLAVKCRVLNCLLDFIQQLFSGRHVEDYQRRWDEEHAIHKEKSTRPSLTIEEKARRIAVVKLKAVFRLQHGLGSRGRLSWCYQEQCDRFVETHVKVATRTLKEDLTTRHE